MARAALGWNARKLATKAGVGHNTVNRFESGVHQPRGVTLEALRGALESAGVEFTNGGQPGVRMKFIDVARRPDGTWGVKSVWAEGTPAEIVTPNVARDIAVAAQRRGNVAWGERVIAAAAKADNLNNNLDENGTPEGWTIDPDEADKPPPA
jgi:transcriptional regulator with XRE-family HTH domain